MEALDQCWVPITLVIFPKETRGETGEAIVNEWRLALKSDSHFDNHTLNRGLCVCVCGVHVCAYVCVSDIP